VAVADRRLVFDLIGRDRLSGVLDHAGDHADRMARRIERASDDSNQAIDEFTRNADGRLRDARGRFVAAGDAARRMGDDVDGGSRRSGSALQRLRGIAQAAGAGLLALGTAGASSSSSLLGVGVAAGVSAAPALGALIPMLTGGAAAALTAKLAFSGVGEAAGLAGEDQKKYAEALGKMSKPQADFTKQLVDSKKEFSGLGKDVQAVVLPSFTKALKDAAPTIKVVKGGIEGMAEVFADFGDTFGKLFGSGQFQDALRKNLFMGQEFIARMISPMSTLTQSLLDFGAKSKPTLDSFGRGISGLMGQGVPGFFKGLEGGISGAAKMFDGLLAGITKLLPALGEFAGKVADSMGPALGQIFESGAKNATVGLKALGDVIQFLKPLFGEVGAMARIMSLELGVIADIAKTAGTVVLESLWPSFRQADQAVGPLQRLATWLENNKGAVLEFTRAASSGIVDFAGSVVQHVPEVIQLFRLMATGMLTALDGLISGAAHAFGWIPGLGPKLQTANREFDKFKNGFITGLHNAEDSSRSFADRVAPRLAANKLRMNIDNWTSQIAIAKQKLSDKNLPSSKKAALRADIADLTAKVVQAKRELKSVKDQSATLTVTRRTVFESVTRSGGSTQAAKNAAETMGRGRASGGLVPRYAGGGDVQALPYGGLVSGPGTGTSDSILAFMSQGAAMVSNQEFVVNARATARFLPLLEAINSGKLQRFAHGGPVRRVTASNRREIGKDTSRGRLPQLVGSRSQISSMVNELVGDITRAFRGIKTSLDNRLVASIERSNKRLQTLAAQRDSIAARIAAARTFASDTTATARGTAALSSLGEESLTRGGGGIKAALQGKLTQITQFQRYIAILAKNGLNKGLLRQILEMGPEAGFAYASTLAGASKTMIGQINATQSQIDKASTSLGRAGADLLYDSGKNAGRGFLAGLAGQQKAIENLMLRIAKGMQSSIRKALGIRSPSRVMAWLGARSTDGIGVGAVSRIPALRNSMAKVSAAVAGTRIAIPPAVAAGGAPAAAPAMVRAEFHIHGAMDPVAVGREVRRVLLELKRTYGLNIDLGVA
jgi:hypothetical protein